MGRLYEFAGVEIQVSMPEEKFYRDEYRLEPFRVDEAKEPHEFHFEMVEQLDEPAGDCVVVQPGLRVYQDGDWRIRYIGSVQHTLEGAYIRVANAGRENRVQLLAEKFPERVGTKTVLNAIQAEHLVVQAGGVIVHCSFIEWKGKGILFTAPSETGKSTQAHLWEKFRGAEVINGDRAVVRFAGNQILADGIPFSGSSKECKKRSVPIAAIVYLGQASETTIHRVTGYEAFSKIWEGVTVNIWNRLDVELASDIVSEVVSRVPIYHLQCTPDESAVRALEAQLEGV